MSNESLFAMAYSSATILDNAGKLTFTLTGKKGNYQVRINGGSTNALLLANGSSKFKSITAAREAAEQFDRIWLLTIRTDAYLKIGLTPIGAEKETQ